MSFSEIRQCQNCGLSKTRRNVVVGRGDIPADVIFIGEAPGKTDDLLGEAFKGAQGKLLNAVVTSAMQRAGISLKCYFTNTVLCRPCNDKAADTRVPKLDEILSCQTNLSTIISKVKPKYFVAVGEIAAKYFLKEHRTGIKIHHPGFLLKTGGGQSPHYFSTIKTLENYFNENKTAD